jgi:hypothetical protein
MIDGGAADENAAPRPRKNFAPAHALAALGACTFSFIPYLMVL